MSKVSIDLVGVGLGCGFEIRVGVGKKQDTKFDKFTSPNIFFS